MVICMSKQSDVLHVVLLYYHQTGTILAEPNYQGSPRLKQSCPLIMFQNLEGV